MKKMDVMLTNGICSYDMDIIKENSASYYVADIFGTTYRVSKKDKKFYRGRLLMGKIVFMEIY
jgi:hypothetical protein